MQSWRRAGARFACLGSLAVALAGGAWGCGTGGGGTGTECGPGTHAEDGTCVPDLEECAPGTVLQLGVCVPACGDGGFWDGQGCQDVTRCAAGTRYDEATGDCLPACTAGQYWDGAACAEVPACGPGTAFDPASGDCQPSADACAPGTVWQDGACVPELGCGPGTHPEGELCVPDALPTPDVTEAAVDGETAEFELPDPGQGVLLGGTVDLPVDKDEDGVVDGDWDAFAFDAPAGAWLRLTATSAGAALPAFLVDARTDDGQGELIYRRVALSPDQGTCSREVYLPRAGRYAVWVTDFNQAAAFLFGYGTLPVGGPAFDYLVRLENLGTPQPEPLALPTQLDHDLGGGALAFFTLASQSPGAGIELLSRPTRPAGLAEADAYPALLLMDPAGALEAESVSYRTWESAALLTPSAAGGPRLVVRDFFAATGAEPAVTFLARRLEPTPCSAGQCTQALVSQEQSLLLRWNLTAGDFFVAGTYFDPLGEALAHQQLLDAELAPLGEAQLTYPGQDATAWAYADRATTFHLWLRWGDGGPQGTWALDARVHATGTLQDGQTASAQPVFDMPPYTLRPAGLLHFSGLAGKLVFLTGLTTHGAGWVQPFEMVWNPRLEQEGPVVDTNAWNFPDGYATPLFTYIRDDGHHLYYVYDQGGDPSGGTYDVSLSAVDVTPIGRPAVGAPIERNNQMPNGHNYYSFEAGQDQVVDITVHPVLLSDIQAEIWVLNFGAVVWDWIWYLWVASPEAPQLGLVVTETAAAPGDDFTVRYLSPYDGLSILFVMDAGGQAGPLDLFNLTLDTPAAPAPAGGGEVTAMRALRRMQLLAAGLALLALGLSACDGGDPQDMLCGAGTVEQDGRCLPEITGCGDGTVLQGGVCVPACPAGEYWSPTGCLTVPACADGTVFDAASGACVPACGPEEQWDGQACAPLCAPGTQLDPQSGECLPGPEVCAAGTHLEAGQCVADLACGPGTHAEGGVCLPDRLPAPDVWEAADPAQAAAVELPAAGQSVRLGGTVDTPEDGNGDGYVEADWDAFAVDAPAGAWLRLAATSEGAALPAFFIQSEALDDQGYALYARYALNPVDLPAEREVYLPRAGRYFILVSDYHNMMVDVFGYGFLPVGGEEFSYQLVVENLGTPQPTPANLPLSDAGQLEDGALRFYTLSGLAPRDVLSVRSLAEGVADQEDDLLQAFLLFDPQGGLLREEIGGWSEDAAVSLVVTAAGDHLLVQDFLVAIGPNPAYAVSAVEESVEDCTLAACTVAPLGAGEHRLWSFDLAAGDFFLFSASLPSGSESLGVRLLDQDFQVLSEGSAGSTWERWDHLLAAADTWVYLWIEGWSGGAVPDWTLDAVQFPVPVLPAGGALDGVAVEPMPGAAFGDSGLVRFEAQAGQMAVVTGFTPHDPGGAWTQPALELIDPQLVVLGPALDTADAALARLAPALAWFPADGTFLARALDLDPAADLTGASCDLGLVLATPTALGEPTAGAPVGLTGLGLAADARVALFSVDVAQGGSYQVALGPQAGSDLQPEVWVLAFGSHYQVTWYSQVTGRELGRLGLASAGAPGEAVSLPVSAPYAGRLVVVVLDARGLDPAPAGLFDLQISRN